jgi:DNA-binding response OmpR family regulator
MTAQDRTLSLGMNASAVSVGSATRVLICDDDPLLTEMVEYWLKNRGFSVLTVNDGADAQEALVKFRPQLLVLDVMMPGMNGLQLLQQIKKDPETRHVQVVMLTSLKRESDIIAALKAGAEDYLVKPFIPDELVLRVERLMSRPLILTQPRRAAAAAAS